MAEFELLCPDDAELADAHEALDEILRLDDYGEIDLPPYLVRLLLQLDELLLRAAPVAQRA